MREFWNAAAALDLAARDLTEDKRFPFCTPDGPTALAVAAGRAGPARRVALPMFHAPTSLGNCDASRHRSPG